MSANMLRIILIIIISGIGVFFAMNPQLINAENIQQLLQSSNSTAPFIFMLLYIISTILFLPGSILTLLGERYLARYMARYTVSAGQQSAQ